MDTKRFEKFIAFEDTSITEAMKKIDSNTYGTLLVVGKDNRLVGAISDGDIRRWLIKTGDLSVTVMSVMNVNPKFIFENQINDAESIIEELFIHVLPIVDDEKKIVDIVIKEKNNGNSFKGFKDQICEFPVVIMAGGRGTRLYPYTKILPKPLIPINDIPIVERIINEFRKYGSKELYLSINYKKEMIKSYFKESECGYGLKYVEEIEPLGTAGSLRLLKDDLSGDIIVTNCDILIKADYSEIIKVHKESGNAVTIVAAMMDSKIPYGVIHSEQNGRVTSLEEKPTISYVVNTGMYIINSKYLSRIPENTFYHMTNLVDDLLKDNVPVGIYPISGEAFLDMGEFVEMQRMEEKLKETFHD